MGKLTDGWRKHVKNLLKSLTFKSRTPTSRPNLLPHNGVDVLLSNRSLCVTISEEEKPRGDSTAEDGEEDAIQRSALYCERSHVRSLSVQTHVEAGLA